MHWEVFYGFAFVNMHFLIKHIMNRCAKNIHSTLSMLILSTGENH